MRAGRLRHRVTIETPNDEASTYGGPKHVWVPVATVWASVEPLQGREFMAARAANAETTHRVGMRYRGGVTAKQRINFDGRILEIESVMNRDERNAELQLMCKEVG